MTLELTVVDLFAGAGGLSLGLQQAGMKIICAVDNWFPAVETYRANFGGHVDQANIDRQLSLPKSTVIVGGPPCQGFSSAGSRRSDDSRNNSVIEFSQIVAKNRPRAFLFENVEGFLTGAEGRFVPQLLEPLIEAGYRIHLRKVNAANYGVPQHRKRVIALGGLGWDPTFPEATHAAHGAPGAGLATNGQSIRTPTVADALAGFPPARLASPSEMSDDHSFIALKGDDLVRAQQLGQGQRMRDLPEHLWHKSYRRRAFRRVRDGTPSERRGGAPAGVRRLRWDEPAKAITGGASREFLHPTEDRPLTLRECAALQSFPLDFRFVGTASERIQLVGNSVPPTMARCFAEHLADDLRSQNSFSRLDGALLSFVPTLSTGMSPALERVCQSVAARFPHPTSFRQAKLWD